MVASGDSLGRLKNQERKDVKTMLRASLSVVLLYLTSLSVCFAQAERTTCVVVVDPQANTGYYGGGGGYYWSNELSVVAKQELEVTLKNRGFLVLLNANDVGPTQEEISLENSEWGKYGAGRNDKGYFSGAAEMFYVSAFTYGGRDMELSAQFSNISPSIRLADLKVKVIVRRTNTKTREVPEIVEGYGSKRIVKDVRIELHSSNPWLQLASKAIEASLTTWQDAGRAATRSAIENALKSVQAPQTLAATGSSAAAGPRFIYLALRGEAEVGDRFGIWRNGAMIAEVAVETVTPDGRARCRVIRSQVSNLGSRGDVARPTTPTVPVE